MPECQQCRTGFGNKTRFEETVKNRKNCFEEKVKTLKNQHNNISMEIERQEN